MSTENLAGAYAGLGIASLAVVVLCIFVPLFLCLWCKTRREVEILKRRVEHESVVGRKDHQHNNTELTEYTKEPLSETSSHPEYTFPSPIKPRVTEISPNYAAVNNLAILPDELRTPENLELGHLPEKDAQHLMAEYAKKQVQYEEARLVSSVPKPEQQVSTKTEASRRGQMTSALPMTASSPPRPSPEYEDIEATRKTSEVKESSQKPIPPSFSQPTPGYEVIDPVERPQVSDYNDPIDCLPPNLRPKITGKSSPQKKKTFQLSTSADDYTEVFDSLPSGVPAPIVRTMSDSRPNKRNSHNGSPTQCDRIPENGLKEEPYKLVPGGSVDNVEGVRERNDPSRQSKRDSGKEVVELDLSKKRFRVASKSSKQEDNIAIDKTDGESSPKAGSPKKVEESYAVVNLADKQCYRTESDSMKKEGSGVPGHYDPGYGIVGAMST